MAEETVELPEFTLAVAPLIEALHKKFPEGICVSDIRDELGRQYVDLVQEGGGVHGIALAGYTYVLEKMNIGFMKMAGTSAGSINTLLLNAVLTEAENQLLQEQGFESPPTTYYETRSEKVLEYLCAKDLRDMVDGHPKWRRLLLNIFTPGKGSIIGQTLNNYKHWFMAGALFLIVLLVASVGLAFYTFPNGLQDTFKWSTVGAAVGLICVLAFFLSKAIFARLLYLHAERFGVNSGKDFEDWINRILTENHCYTVDHLNQKLEQEKRVLRPRYSTCKKAYQPNAAPSAPYPENLHLEQLLDRIRDKEVKVEMLYDDLNKMLNPDTTQLDKVKAYQTDQVIQAFEQRLAQDEEVTKELVLVSSDITHELKVEFPGMHKMYWGNDFSISPAKYVRASMSVPLFFKPMEVRFNPSQRFVINQEWEKFARVHKQLGESALFVDGGLLSNFPINVFYNPDMPVPRKPTFGVKLEYEDETMSKSVKSLLGFAGSIISTMRFFYDRDFALKHDIYQKTVRSIDTGNIHWLNFNLSSREKVELFFRGALAATIFLAKHQLTDGEVQNLMQLGKNVAFKETTFSIYQTEETTFHIEDCLLANLTFEWEAYKKERLLDRITKSQRKQVRKESAALQNLHLHRTFLETDAYPSEKSTSAYGNIKAEGRPIPPFNL